MLKTELEFCKEAPPLRHNSYHNKLLIPDASLQILPLLAVKIGLNEAIILQQVHYWIRNPLNEKVIDGRVWVYNTYEQWKKQFPFWSCITIKRTILSLENKKLLISGTLNENPSDRTKWYTIDYEALNDLEESGDSLDIGTSYQNDTIHGINLIPSPYQNDTIHGINLIRSTNTKITTKITTKINPLLPREPVIKKSFDSEFEEFWAINPKPVDKAEAKEVFNRLLTEDYGNFQKIMTGRRNQNVVIELEGTQRKYIKGPASWLRKQRFNDEVQTQEQLHEEHQRSVSKITNQSAGMSKFDLQHSINDRIIEAAERKLREFDAQFSGVAREGESSANGLDRESF